MPKQSDLFLPHRMAYVVDLNDEETDVPITSIRSKAECLSGEVVEMKSSRFFFSFKPLFFFMSKFKNSNITLSTNDIVINKLTQILAYLRHGKKDAKKLKKKTMQVEQTAQSGINNTNSGLRLLAY
jgi:IK cytokine